MHASAWTASYACRKLAKAGLSEQETVFTFQRQKMPDNFIGNLIAAPRMRGWSRCHHVPPVAPKPQEGSTVSWKDDPSDERSDVRSLQSASPPSLSLASWELEGHSIGLFVRCHRQQGSRMHSHAVLWSLSRRTRNAMAAAACSGTPTWPTAVTEPAARSQSSVLMPRKVPYASMPGVRSGPGCTALTRRPLLAYLSAQVLVRYSRPALAVLLEHTLWSARRPEGSAWVG